MDEGTRQTGSTAGACVCVWGGGVLGGGGEGEGGLLAAWSSFME